MLQCYSITRYCTAKSCLLTVKLFGTADTREIQQSFRWFTNVRCATSSCALRSLRLPGMRDFTILLDWHSCAEAVS